jgi:hypothetical protein
MKNAISTALLFALIFLGTELTSAAAPIEQIHGGTCWVAKDGSTIKAVSFNDRAVGFWNGTTLREDAMKILTSAQLTPGADLQVSLACSDLGHQVIVRGVSLLGQPYCLSTNMDFSRFELMGDDFPEGSVCHPYGLQQILIYEPDEEVRGQVLSVLTARRYAGDIETISVEGSVIEVKLRSIFRFKERMFLKALESDKSFPEGVAIGLNDIMGFPSEQVELGRIRLNQ